MSLFTSTVRVVAGALVVPAALISGASTAQAADLNVLCVGVPVGVTCDSTVATIQLAGQTAFNAAGDDLIAVGPGTYSALGATLSSNAEGSLTLQGSGDSTVITMPSDPTAQNYIFAIGAVVRDLRIEMTGGTDSNLDVGVRITDGSVHDVTIVGPDTQNATGITATNATVDNASVQLAPTSGRGLQMSGDVEATDLTITANTGVLGGEDSGLQHLGRARMNVCAAGVSVSAGEVTVDHTLIDLGSCGARALNAGNSNDGASSAFITADHVTIVGGGSNSRGASAYAGHPGGRKSSTILLSNSVIDGPEAALWVYAANDGNQGGSSESFVGVSYSAYDPAKVFPQIDANGTGGVAAGVGNTSEAPQFLDAAAKNYRPAPGSPLIDSGNPAAGPPALDLLGSTRVADGNGDITAVRDMGAYEVPDTFAAQTSSVGGPSSPMRDRTPTFTFSSEPGAAFTCRIDARTPVPCTSPFTASSLADGTHKVTVTARDAAGNADPTPSTRTFVIDNVAPNTRFLAKPASTIRTSTARFRFAAPGAVRFQCKLDARPWRACISPKVFSVAKGRHVVRIRGIDRAGNVDQTPALYRFKRV